jgi:arginase
MRAAVNEVIFTPFFLDAPIEGAGRLVSPDWRINASAGTGSGQVERMAAIHRPLADAVSAAAGRGARPVSIAGDCCATIAVLAGLQRAGLDPLLVWLDAHGDFNTPETSPSGFIGGMPLAMIVGRGDQSLARAAGLRPLAESDVILADARDLDPEERKAVEGSAVRHVTDLSLIPALLPPGRPVYVHLDPDVIDPAEAPAMHYAARGGPSLADVCRLARRLAASLNLAAVSLTLWDLPRDPDRRTERACLAALTTLIGDG